LIAKPKKNVKEVIGGPVRVGQLIGESTYQAFEEGPENGVRAFFTIVSLISLSLAFINLLPIPALDGGHILFNIIEIIRRKPISIKIINIINMIFFFILITFIIFVIAFIDIPDLFK
jgi:regulator of sigma E protease